MNSKYCVDCGASCMQTMRSCPTCGSRKFSDSPAVESSESPILTSSHEATQEAGAQQTATGTARDAAQGPPVKVRGWLLFFVFTLAILLVNQIANILIYLDYVRSIPDGGSVKEIIIALICVDACLGLYALYVGVQLWNIKVGAVRVAKTFLVVQFVVVLGQTAVWVLILDSDEILNDIGSLVYGVIWYSYLTYSKRVKATFNL